MLIFTEREKDITEKTKRLSLTIKILFFIEIGVIVFVKIYNYFTLWTGGNEYFFLISAVILILLCFMILPLLGYLLLNPSKRILSYVFFAIIGMITIFTFTDSFGIIATKIIDERREKSVEVNHKKQYDILVNKLSTEFAQPQIIQNVTIDESDYKRPIFVFDNGIKIESLDINFKDLGEDCMVPGNVDTQVFDKCIETKRQRYDKKLNEIVNYLNGKTVSVKIDSNEDYYLRNIYGIKKTDIYFAHIYLDDKLFDINSI